MILTTMAESIRRCVPKYDLRGRLLVQHRCHLLASYAGGEFAKQGNFLQQDTLIDTLSNAAAIGSAPDL